MILDCVFEVTLLIPIKIIVDLLTLNLLTTTVIAPPSNTSKWQMGFNSAFKGLNDVFSKTRNSVLAGTHTN